MLWLVVKIETTQSDWKKVVTFYVLRYTKNKKYNCCWWHTCSTLKSTKIPGILTSLIPVMHFPINPLKQKFLLPKNCLKKEKLFYKQNHCLENNHYCFLRGIQSNTTANISDLNKSWTPHFSEFYLRLLKLSIWEKIPDRPLEKPLNLIRDISK